MCYMRLGWNMTSMIKKYKILCTLMCRNGVNYMIPICEHTEKSEKQYKEIWEDLKAKLRERGYIDEKYKYPSIYRCSSDVSSRLGYANCQYTGTLHSDLDDLTSLQVAMLCDGGYSWFGGNCSKNGLKFSVKVYTD